MTAKNTISERLRATGGKGQGGPLKAEAADTIDTLVEALEAVELHYGEDSDVFYLVRAAVALARKGGKTDDRS